MAPTALAIDRIPALAASGAGLLAALDAGRLEPHRHHMVAGSTLELDWQPSEWPLRRVVHHVAPRTTRSTRSSRSSAR